MPTAAEQLNANISANISANIASSSLQPIFADSTAIAMRMKAFKNAKGAVEKEGLLEIIFIDMVTQKPVGEFVITKNTAKELLTGLTQHIATLEKELASKDLPKPPEIKPAGDTSSYR